MSSTKRQILASLVAATSSFNQGANIGISAVLIPALQAEKNEDLRLDLHQGSVLISLAILPGMVGAILCGMLADRLGRRFTLLFGQIPFLTAMVVAAVASKAWHLYISRVLAGFTTGFALLLPPVYISEVASPDLRGSLANLTQVFQCLTLVLTLLTGGYLSWRDVHWIVFGVALISFFLMLIFLTETPYFLVTADKNCEAAEALQKLRGITQCDAELEEIIEQHERKKEMTQGNGWSFLMKPSFLKPFSIVGLSVGIIQFNGHTSVQYYMINIFQESGSHIDPYLASVCSASIRLITAAASSMALRYWPRKQLYLWSGLLASLALIVLTVNNQSAGSAGLTQSAGLAQSVGSAELPKSVGSAGLTKSVGSAELNTSVGLSQSAGLVQSAGSPGSDDSPSVQSFLTNWTPIGCVMVVFACWSFGQISVLTVYAAEVFAMDVRSRACSMCSLFGQLCAAVNCLVYPYLLDWVGFAGSYYLMAGINLVVMVYGYVLLPPAEDKTLVEIEKHFEQRTPLQGKSDK